MKQIKKQAHLADITLKQHITTEVIFEVIRDGKCINRVKTSNLILNKFKTDCYQSLGGYLFVGTGTSEPQVTDTQLSNRIGPASNNVSIASGNLEPITDLTRVSISNLVCTFPLGSIVGNITEFGLANSANTSSYLLYTRGLIKNTEGNLTAITVTNQDQLVVTYSIRRTFTCVEAPFSVTAESITYTGKIHIGHYARWYSFITGGYTNRIMQTVSGNIVFTKNPITGIFTPTGSPQAGSAGFSITNKLALTGSANGRIMTYTCSAALSDGNYASGIKAILNGNGNLSYFNECDLLIIFDTPLPKTADKLLSFTLTVTEVIV